jgi:hypothetical protein
MKLTVGFEQEEGVTGKHCELNGSSYERMRVTLGGRSIKKCFTICILQLIS